MVAVSGNTYPVKDALRAMGGKWDASAKAWLVPDEKAEEAKALVAGTPKSVKKELTKTDFIAIKARKNGETPGVCSSCGGKCKYPWTECWDCKEERDMGY